MTNFLNEKTARDQGRQQSLSPEQATAGFTAAASKVVGWLLVIIGIGGSAITALTLAVSEGAIRATDAVSLVAPFFALGLAGLLFAVLGRALDLLHRIADGKRT
ncbi:hypothetical protein HH303_05310 [Rhodospirillaceae bacterium KN72]|uniref:Uncharacterized protein n=1 Tax=Pacificispira spongiicola TaxID=2729598 RepID=A0A7Y0HET0_9PROT|nr:hypothetical protein [Pacificispira spongiicola]NMM43883.1 hypothetical protein [Pacificispira spongiicola]